MNLFLIDGIGPFFRGYTRRRINWSKIPFDHLEHHGRLDKTRLTGILKDFTRFVDTAANLGFNGITLDDLAHLSLHPAYSPALAAKLRGYRETYARLFELASARGLTVFITTDVTFTPVEQPAWRRQSHRDIVLFFHDICSTLFRDFPSIGGVIFRVGECDAGDVQGDFTSHLALRTARQANGFIRHLLPVFEQNNKLLIFRTWTVGAHPIGDLIWNRNTFDRAFRGLDSPSFVLSMKYGETDFFRYLPLNKMFFRSNHRKLIEFQARREYEGFGEFPSFVGWDYEDYVQRLSGARNVIGAWIWCQTGGWAGFRRRTFLDPGGVWNEINAVVTLRLVRERQNADQAIHAWARERLGAGTSERLRTLLQLSNRTIKEAFYIDEFAQRKLFFRRLRIPPILHIFWDHIIINRPMRALLRCFVRDPARQCAQARAALDHIRTMQAIAADLGLPTTDFDFQYDTFEILTAARDYYFSEARSAPLGHLKALKTHYERKYAIRYSVHLDDSRLRLARPPLRMFVALLFRSQRGYRWLDRLLLIRLLSLIAPLVTSRKNRTGEHLMGQAMGIQTILK